MPVPAEQVRRSQQAAATDFGYCQLGAAPGPALLLASFPTAGYLQLANGTVLAVLAADAIRLPIGLLLATASVDQPIDGLLGDRRIEVADQRLLLGDRRIELAGRWSARLPRLGRPNPALLAGADALVAAALRTAELPTEPVADLLQAPAATVGQLLGRGPGLTPAGDDLLCGVLAGARMFGLGQPALVEAIGLALTSRPRATTSLSRQLLYRAVAGEGIAQLAELGRALTGAEPSALRRAWQALDRVGHSSGPALGAGILLIAARAALADRELLGVSR